MSPIPWAAILTHGPALVAAAQSLLANQTKKVNERHQSMEVRLAQLEKASVESARLLQELAQQVQALTLAQQKATRHARTALIVGSVAAVMAMVTIVLAFLIQ